ncbi:MAG: hypothetical protein ACI8RZ_005289 [Myxococcota bacterium]
MRCVVVAHFTLIRVLQSKHLRHVVEHGPHFPRRVRAGIL